MDTSTVSIELLAFLHTSDYNIIFESRLEKRIQRLPSNVTTSQPRQQHSQQRVEGDNHSTKLCQTFLSFDRLSAPPLIAEEGETTRVVDQLRTALSVYFLGHLSPVIPRKLGGLV